MIILLQNSNPNNANLVYNLFKRDIRFIIDDSKSIDEMDAKDSFDKLCSRWQSLGKRIEVTAEIAACLDQAYGAYQAKVLLGPIKSEYDSLDEVKPAKSIKR